MSSTTVSCGQAILDWLKSAGATGIDMVEVKRSSDLSDTLGCFALKPFAIGETVFAIPQSCIPGFHSTEKSNILNFVKKSMEFLSSEENFLISEEFLFWLYMIQQRQLSRSGTFGPYFTSLGTNIENFLSFIHIVWFIR